ncbi:MULTISPECIES: sigma-70 family RNA polymerase sigma factor family protein [Streptomyces]|uniref:RNA polymerase subunit sigma n=1 Tax=Streptomyces edwardsiae TaxID=3075527 RepID=A0ABU2QAI6_9ACTN|nr:MULTISPECIES: RNA polymerase sigma factor [unclassified Streptomyces]MDT0401466.1 RNA polymerase subunit sigma [Streptomyces sp. DSM 41635]
MDRAEDGVPIAELLDERRHLLDVASWMLGGARDADGVVDEAYRRWYALSGDERDGIGEPRSWLARVVGGICLARLAPPEPGPTRPGPHGMLEEEISGVLLDALDSLSPAERAAFVLDDVFGTAPGAVADIVGQTGPERAGPADRARDGLRAGRARPATVQQHDAVARAVRHACTAEDTEHLASLLAPDVTAFFDGGGKVRALVEPVHGHVRVARSMVRLLAGHPHTTLDTHSVNGRTGLVVRYDRQVAAVISLDIADHHVVRVWVVLNPDKLRSWNPGRH